MQISLMQKPDKDEKSMEHQREALIDSGEHMLFYNKLGEMKWQGLKNDYEGFQHIEENSEKSEHNKRDYQKISKPRDIDEYDDRMKNPTKKREQKYIKKIIDQEPLHHHFMHSGLGD